MSFYGYQDCEVPAICEIYSGIKDPKDLYDSLKRIWSVETCAPRMRKDWSPENPSLGQCTISAFLVQDIFGGKVYGVPLNDGNYHCFNAVDRHVFDITSEQFERKLDYTLEYEQFREEHFAKTEKKERYELLKRRLKEDCEKKRAV